MIPRKIIQRNYVQNVGDVKNTTVNVNAVRVDSFYRYGIIRNTYSHQMEDFIFEVVIDICSKTFKLKSDNGNSKIIACEDTTQFMRVLDVCDRMVDPENITYADLAVTTDK